jgi:hypothetical protein
LHPATEQHSFPAAHGTFFKIDHIISNKASLNKYKKTEITPCILSDHNTINLEFNNKKQAAENTQKLEPELRLQFLSIF